jgi:hypothetical protein
MELSIQRTEVSDEPKTAILLSNCKMRGRPFREAARHKNASIVEAIKLFLKPSTMFWAAKL